MAEVGEDPENTTSQELVTCGVCFEYMTDSRTLFPCMHSFCAKCVERLDIKQQEGKIGILCPMCREFIQQDAIKPKLTINDMVNIITPTQQCQALSRATCGSCGTAIVTSRCFTCSIDFCKNCSKGHTHVPSSKHDNTVAISDLVQCSLKDVVLYCSIHKEEEIEMNSKPCNQIICSKCKFEQHDNHDSESLQEAINRFMPTIQSAITSISQHNNSKKGNIAVIEKQLAELEQNQRDNERKLEGQREKVLKQVNKEYSQLKEQLKITTGAKIKKLTLQKQELEQYLACGVKSLANAITENTDGAGLLRVFQSGLLQKIKNLQQQDQPLNVDLKFVTFEPTDLSVLTANSILGKVTHWQHSAQHPLKMTVPSVTTHLIQTASTFEMGISGPSQKSVTQTVNNSYRHTSLNLNTLRNKRFTRLKQFKVTKYSLRFCLYNQKLWFPGNYNGNIIQVYSTEGELLDTIYLNEISRPISLHPLGLDDHFVLAAHSGLYLLNNKCEIQSLIHMGNFEDVYVQGNVMAALCRTDKQVYVWDINDLSQPKHTLYITLGGYISTLFVYNSCIYVCDCESSIIHQYNMQGQHIQQYGKKGSQGPGQLKGPGLTDIQGNMLVADHDNNRLQVLSATGQWSVLDMSVDAPWDAIIADNTLYVLYGYGVNRKISNYKL